MSDDVNIKINDRYIEVEGIKFSWFLLKETFTKVPPGLFSFERIGEHLQVTRHDTLESCGEYLAKQGNYGIPTDNK